MAYNNARQSKKIRLSYPSDAPTFAANTVPTVYTDGACSNNGRGNAKAGYGVYWGDGHPDNISASLDGPPTNNRAEYAAVISAVRQAKEHGYKELRVCTDSKLIISSMTSWVEGWRKRGWKKSDGTPILNPDLVQELYGLMQEVNVQFEHVNGHAGIHGNEMADQLAVAGANRSTASTNLPHTSKVAGSSMSALISSKALTKMGNNNAKLTNTVTELNVPEFDFLNYADHCDIMKQARQSVANVLTGDPDALRDKLEALIACVDLTTLAGDDTRERVQTLAQQADLPISKCLRVKCAAVCVYPLRVRDVVERLRQLKSHVRVAAVAGGFPSGQYHLASRLLEIRLTVADGATEIDVVINRGAALEGDWQTVVDELMAMRKACGTAHMKVILAVGELNSFANVYRASWAAMLAGADFIKTSTGKEAVNATLPYAYVMLKAIRDFERSPAGSSRRVGFKAAGGIRTVAQALEFAALPAIVFDEASAAEWTKPERFRIGASGLLQELVNAIGK